MTLKALLYKFYIQSPLGKIGSILIPAGKEEQYTFQHAQRYWHNIPRAQGGNFFNSTEIQKMSDRDLLREFDAELEKARKKEERKVGFALAHEIIASIENPAVIDYGSGIGFYGFEIMHRHPSACVTFVDINNTNLQAILRIAELKGWQQRTQIALVHDEQAQTLAFSSQFDMIVSMGVLHHTPYAPQIVRHLTQFLKKDGIFLVMLYNYTYLHHFERSLGRRLNVSTFGAMTDPVCGDAKNPYSEPYDDAKAQKLFEEYDLISVDYPVPYYNMYKFKKTMQ